MIIIFSEIDQSLNVIFIVFKITSQRYQERYQERYQVKVEISLLPFNNQATSSQNYNCLFLSVLVTTYRYYYSINR